MAATLTAQDIARRIRRPNEELTAAVDRLRNWTKEGLIKPVGDLHPGTGRKKRYAAGAVTKAVVLQILSDATGGTAGYLSVVVDAIAPVLHKAHERKAIVVLSLKYGTRKFDIAMWEPEHLGQAMLDSMNDVHIVLNPHRIIDRLDEVFHQ
jgi:hypothetical protein